MSSILRQIWYDEDHRLASRRLICERRVISVFGAGGHALTLISELL